MTKLCLIFGVLISLFTGSCSNKRTLFILIPSTQTGLEFENTLTPTDSINILNYEYFYNGASVSIGDFNNDGLSDLFFTGNMVSNRMYLNRGHLKFADISETAGIGRDNKWHTGSAVADVNKDGFLDIYVCASVNRDSTKRANSLYISQGLNEQGIPVFKDMAKEYGVEELGHSQNAAFLDYDLDGDLDLYVLTNFVSQRGPANYHPKVVDGSALNNDQLYRNNGDNTFTNVTIEAGIVYEGYGLGIAIADLNLDGWPDIFIGNDYVTNDLVYINNQDGTFSNQAKKVLKHQSRFSMGNDISDINNDGLVDIYSLDMLPQINYRKKTSSGGGTSYQSYINNETLGYEYQYIRNMMHINNGNAPFSEVGQMMGLQHTEWSWSPLFFDVDNDGLLDLLITNGFPKDLTDMDYIRFRNDVGTFTKPNQLLMILPELKLPNYGYKNHGDLNFTDYTAEWGLSTPSYSNGAAFADLDNDGDLDYVVTNIDEKVHLYENTLYTNRKKENSPHYLRVKLIDKRGHGGLGTKIALHYDEGKMQFRDHSIYRGYLSTVEDFVHFGLGDKSVVDSLEIIWPDGSTQLLQNVAADQVLTINRENADRTKSLGTTASLSTEKEVFKEVSSALGIYYKHKEIDQIDYYIQKTLPHKFSQAGPSLAVGDINGDELEDFIIGGSSMHNATIFMQDENGVFHQSELIKGYEQYSEDEGILLFDADGDQDLDLYAVSGSYEFVPGNERYKDRLYLNDGNGIFTLSNGLVPEETTSGSCVRAADFDQDGDLDLFIGGRVITGNYPLSPESYIFRNDSGVFIDVTSEVCNTLSAAGMVTDAIWSDYDNNGTTDLIVVGEFMAVNIYKNTGGKLTGLENSGIHSYAGWWNSINGADIDKDGDTDYVVGNLGLNNTYNITLDQPLKVYAKDFDNNGSIDPILSCYFKTHTGEMAEFAAQSWDILGNQIPKIKHQFENYSQYASSNILDILSAFDTTGMLILEVNYPMTSYIENLGEGKFRMHPLPKIAQFAPVNGIQKDDVNNDGNLDLLLVGNDFGNEIISGRLDALNGAVLIGNGKGEFYPMTSLESGFIVPGDAKALARLSTNTSDFYIATQNQDSLLVYNNSKKDVHELKIYKPKATDSWAELVYEGGQVEKVEFYFGAGCLTQSSRTIRISDKVEKIIVHGFDGISSVVDMATLIIPQ